MSSSLRLIPLGGLGEIGMNCMAIECQGDVLVVDCGVTFSERNLGVDVVHPNFAWLLERRDSVRAVVLTHGHEDHIGALPYLLRHVPVPVYGPPYALGLTRQRLEEHGLLETASLYPIRPRMSFGCGVFEVEPIRVAHSIADAIGLAIRSPAGLLVHSGDFKLDEGRVQHERFDDAHMRELGAEGVRLLLSDSTNVDNEHPSHDEAAVAGSLTRLIREAPERVVISLFASNVHRLSMLLEVARETGRSVCLLGRSMQTHARIATELGYLPKLGPKLIAPEDAQSVARSELMVIATGSQGEPAAALVRLAAREHQNLVLQAGDRVVLSARIIPGNERPVHDLVNALERQGIQVHSPITDPDVHSGGHASRSEQRTLIEIVRPRAFLPVHGTFHHLARHAKLAAEVGVRETIVVENGAIVEVDEHGLRNVGQAPSGRVYVNNGRELSEAVLRERSLVACLGFALVVVPLDGTGFPRRPLRVVLRGVMDEAAAGDIVRGAERYIEDQIEKRPSADAAFDVESIEDHARRALRSYLIRQLGRSPVTYAVAVQR